MSEGSCEEAIGGCAAHSQQRPNLLEMQVPWEDHQEKQQVWSATGLSLWEELYVLWVAKPNMEAKVLWSPENCEWVVEV